MTGLDVNDFFERYPSRKLNLGCGADIRDGYTNVDMHDYGRPNSIVGNVTDLSSLPSGSFDEILANDIIEHIRHAETTSVLAEWNRLLAVGGKLNLRSTYLNGLVRLMEKPDAQHIRDQRILLTNLFSRQLVPGDFHYNAFTEPMIRFYLWATGFEIESIDVADGWIWVIVARKARNVFPDYLYDPSLTNREFVERAYQQIMNRPHDDAGLNSYVDRLAQGLSRRDAMREMWASSERQDSLVNDAPAFELTFG